MRWEAGPPPPQWPSLGFRAGCRPNKGPSSGSGHPECVCVNGVGKPMCCQASAPRRPQPAQLGIRQEIAGEQVEEAGDAGQACEDPEPQWQVLQGALQLGVQVDDLAFGDAPLA